jgi:hypothetical protein
VEDAAEADAVLEDAVDLEDGVVRLLRVAVRHVVHVEHDLLHRSATARLPLLLLSGGRGGGAIRPGETGKGRERGSKRRRVGWVLVGRSLAVVVVVLPNTGRIL